MVASRLFFLTLSDNVVQGLRGLNTTNPLERQIKLAVLLSDGAVISAPYFWQSNITFQACMRLYPLMRSDHLRFANRPTSEVSRYSDFLAARTEETSHLAKVLPSLVACAPGFEKEVPSAEAKDRCAVLDAVCGPFYRGGSVSRVFKELWTEYLPSVRERIIRICLSQGVDKAANIQKMIDEACMPSEGNYFSRAECALRLSKVVKLPPTARQVVFKALSHAYLRSNAVVTGSELLSSSGKAYPSNAFGRPDRAVLRNSVDLFQKVLGIFGVTLEHIDAMNAEDILLLKRTPEFRHFLSRYVSMIEWITGSTRDFEKICEVVAEQLFREEAQAAKKQAQERVLRQCEFTFYASLSAILGLPSLLVAAPHISRALQGASAVPVTVAFVSHALSRYVAHKLENAGVTPFYDFKLHILSERYHKDLVQRLLSSNLVK